MLRSPTDHRRFDVVGFAVFATKVVLFLGILVAAFGDVPRSGLLALGALPAVTGVAAGYSLVRSRRRVEAIRSEVRDGS